MRNVILLTSASNEMRGRAMSTVALTQGIGLPGEILTGSLSRVCRPTLNRRVASGAGRARLAAGDHCGGRRKQAHRQPTLPSR